MNQKRTTPLDAQMAIISTAARALIQACKGTNMAMMVDGYEVAVRRYPNPQHTLGE